MSIHPLGKETPPEIEHAYLAGRLEQLQELTEMPQAHLPVYIQQQLTEIKAKIEALVKMREKEGGRSAPRFFWESVSAGRIWLDDPKMVVIGGFKIAPYWQLDIEKRKKSIILPPSLPVFVGKSSDPPCDAAPTQGYIAKLYRVIREEVTTGEKPLDHLWYIKWREDKSGDRGVINRQLDKLGGTFYFDYRDTSTSRIWIARWNKRHRELTSSSDEFIIDIAKQIEAIATGRSTIQQAWDWLDTVELSNTCEGTWGYRTVSLNPYIENNTFCWRLTYKRNPRRVPRHKVAAIANAIRSKNFDEISEWLSC